MGKTIRREGILGVYFEHYDDQGNKVGESKPRKGVVEDYMEHFDVHGNKIGESKEREGIFEDYTEHFDAAYRKTGESKARKGVIEDYTEHFDRDGRKSGESKFRRGIFEDYVEHDGDSPEIRAATSGRQRPGRSGKSTSSPQSQGSPPPGSSGDRQTYFNIGFLVVLALGAALLYFLG